MNTAMFRDKRVQDTMRKKWALWKQHNWYYHGAKPWWVRYDKKQLRHFAHQEDVEWRNDLRLMENYLYESIRGCSQKK